MSSSPTQLGKYRIESEIGRGGMGIVYRAYDPTLDRPVAIKVLPPHLAGEKEFVRRFLREARAAARLHHPNVIAIHDIGEADGTYYFVMDYLPGPSLKTYIEEREQLANADILSILAQLAGALDYAHNSGLIHRDIKPGNIVFDERGRPVLTDFGLVKATQESQLTASGTYIGTPHYMAPEQVTGATVTPAADQYALAIVAFKLLTRHLPFDAGTTPATLYQQVHEPPPPPSAYCPELPVAVDSVLRRALSKQPEARYASCREFANALQAALAGPAGTRSVPEPAHERTPHVTPAREYTSSSAAQWSADRIERFLQVGVGVVVLAVVVIAVILLARTIWWPPALTPTAAPPPAATAVAASPSPVLPAHTPALTATAAATPTLEPRVMAQQAVVRFQQIRFEAWRTCDTGKYPTVLKGDENIQESRDAVANYCALGCYALIVEEQPMSFEFEESTADRVLVIAHRVETRTLVCPTNTKYYCESYDGNYVTERFPDGWYITSKETLNLVPLTPCP